MVSRLFRFQKSRDGSRGDERVLRTGNPDWIYEAIPQWGALPQGKTLGGTHGGIASDKTGNIYISTQSESGILVYDETGKFLRSIANDYPEIHSLQYSTEEGVEYFYATVQKGTPKENWLMLKMMTDGTVVQKIVAPPEAGFSAANEWRLTAAVSGPEGS